MARVGADGMLKFLEGGVEKEYKSWQGKFSKNYFIAQASFSS
jgi:hypothetical protein